MIHRPTACSWILVVVVAVVGCARTALVDDSRFCSVAGDCEVENVCEVAACEGGRCTTRRAANGTSCDDGSYCSVNDSCISGACVGSARFCGALDTDCTVGMCDEELDACVATAQRAAGTEGPFGVATCSDLSDNDCDGAVDAEDAGCSEVRWWDLSWPQRTTISIDARALSTDLTSFPVAVRFSDRFLTNLAGKAIRFIAEDGTTVLPFERENDVAGELFWVRVPVVKAVSNQGFFFAYFRDSAADDPLPSAVWDADFVGVWHMQGGSTTQVRDSSSYGKHGVPVGFDPSSVVPTPLGYGYHFSGGSIRIPSSTLSDVLALTNNFTLEAWVRADADRGDEPWQKIVSRQLGDAQLDAWYIADHVLTREWASTTNAQRIQFAHALPPPDVHVASTRSSSEIAIYVDGQRRRTASVSATPSIDVNDVTIAGEENAADASIEEQFFGVIDEVRISRIPRSADWLRASDMNIKNTLVTHGALESL